MSGTLAGQEVCAPRIRYGAGLLQSAQPAGVEVPAGFAAQNFQRLLTQAEQHQMGVIGIRVLAAGALSGVETRHPIAVPTVDPITVPVDDCLLDKNYTHAFAFRGRVQKTVEEHWSARTGVSQARGALQCYSASAG